MEPKTIIMNLKCTTYYFEISIIFIVIRNIPKISIKMPTISLGKDELLRTCSLIIIKKISRLLHIKFI